jgi:replicative DNA helicase
VKLAGLLEDWQADAEAAHQAKTTGKPRGPVTGLAALDRELGGCLHPGVNIVHGTPGVGKTAFCLQVACHCGCPALFVTCEMSPLELFRRVTARATGTFLGRLKSGELSPAESLALARRGVQAAPLLAFADATQAFAAPAWIREVALAVRGDSPHLLLVVDSIHSWAEAAPGGLTEYDALNAGLAALRALSHELACPVLAVAERNRASMATGGLSAGAGTRKIEYGAEAVIDLSRPEDTKPDAKGEVPVTAKLAKNRHGAVGGVVKLRWHGALQRFEEV